MSSTKPRVGIVSKDRHARNLVTLLEKAEVTPVLLGGDKDVQFPKDVSVVVLRTASCSHAASDAAAAWWRADKKNRTLVWENSAERAIIELGLVRAIPINGYVAKLMGVEHAVERAPLEKAERMDMSARVAQVTHLVAGGVTRRRDITAAMAPLQNGRVGYVLREAIRRGMITRASHGSYAIPGGETRRSPAHAESQAPPAPVEAPVEAPTVDAPVPVPEAAETRDKGELDPSTLSPEIREAMQTVVTWMDEWRVREMVIMGNGTVALSNAPTRRPSAEVKFVVV